jgi:hypothetical protein
VRVTGVIDPRGFVSGLHIILAAAEDQPGRPKSAAPLVQSTIETVRGWRLEESAQRTNFAMTFEFEVTDDFSALSTDLRQFPQRVTIRGNPSLLKDKIPPPSPVIVIKGHGLDR